MRDYLQAVSSVIRYEIQTSTGLAREDWEKSIHLADAKSMDPERMMGPKVKW